MIPSVAGLGGRAMLVDRQDPGHPGAAGGKSGQLFVVLLVHGTLPAGELGLDFQAVQPAWFFEGGLGPRTAGPGNFALGFRRSERAFK